jgi:tetratricopeptide (TPR) repeat protein
MTMRGLLPLILLCLSCAAPSASAQTYQKAYQRCLRTPEFIDEMAKLCTIVIDAPQTSPADRAIALNNRAMMTANEPQIRDLDEAIRLAPKLAKLFNNRGMYYSYADPPKALANYDEALRLDPLYAVAWNNRGEVYLELKRYDEAIRDFREAIRLAPRYMHPMYNPYEFRARAKEAKGDDKGAAADRALYFPLMERASRGRTDIRGPNASGMRAWEPFLAK